MPMRFVWKSRGRHHRALFLPFLLAALCVATLTGTLFAQNQPQAQAPAQEASLQDNGDPFPELLAQAGNGDPKAQCAVGIDYLNGRRVAQDYRLGLHWLGKSSDAGFAYARFVLADVYNRGFAGVPVNDELAYYYASLAAASSTLDDKVRERAAKLREASAKRLSATQLTALQARAAMAPLDAAVGY